MAKHFDPFNGEAHPGRAENCKDMACRAKAAGDERIKMGIRGIKSPEEVAEEKRVKRKDELLVHVRDKNNLSWTVRSVSPYQIDHWACLRYRAVEQDNGSLWIVDQDTDTCVRIYPVGMWSGMHLEYQKEPGYVQAPWEPFLPHDAYLEDLADRLVEEEQAKEPYRDRLPTEDPE